jgi:signal transduction histidine kinase/CheY-like chemotaxis protein/HPt (histidine-containing phosphotransfer) domain-containing protein
MNEDSCKQLAGELPKEQLEVRLKEAEEKEKRAAELIIANKELAFQNEEKDKRAAELIIANKELAFQNGEKEKRAAELIIANKELAFQNEEKDKRAAELIIANKELAFQNEEKEKRAAELIIANKELAFQNEEKEKRAAELIIANKELAFQNKEKGRRAIQTGVLKEQNIELEIQKKQLDEASQLKSAFLSNMSHELRTPLNAIVGFIELALKTNLTAQQHNYLSKIKISSHTLLGLISDILDLSKIEAGKLELEMTAFNLEEVLQKAVNQVSVKSQEKGLRLMVYIDKDMPVILNGDPLRLGQVLLNLLSNAVKFTDEGEIVIRAEALDNNGTDALIQFSVKDTGIGLAEEQIKKLFQPFTQADTSTTRKYGGTGLGLSISQKLVNLMNGNIWAESEVRVGSTFFFTVRMNVADKETFRHYKNSFEKWEMMKVLVVDDKKDSREIIGSMLADMSLEVTLSTSGEKIAVEYLSQLQGTRVLLVEDNEINREVAQEILQQAGLKVTIADNGRKAVDMVKANTYDIVLMDIQMPIMDGYDAAREIRKDPVFVQLPIIAMTANALISDQEKCLAAGMNDHVAKPIDTTQLFQKIAHWVKKEQETFSRKVPLDLTAPHMSANKAFEMNNINSNIVAIDLETALSRLGGNRKFYDKLLMKFYKNHKHTVKEIRYALESGDFKGAEILAHTIKGAAGNIGAQDVYVDASALEAGLRANKFDEVELLLGHFEHILEQTFTSISHMGKNSEDMQDSQYSHSDRADMSQLKPILDKLEKLLSENNMEAVECVEELVTQAKNAAFALKTVEMKDYVDQYDFEGALGIFNEIRNSMGEVS